MSRNMSVTKRKSTSLAAIRVDIVRAIILCAVDVMSDENILISRFLDISIGLTDARRTTVSMIRIKPQTTSNNFPDSPRPPDRFVPFSRHVGLKK